ncbi:MAG: NAD(P)H-dependent oxidoreductase [Pseudomonadota bacterium]
MVFHPNLASSRVNRIWRDQIQCSGKVAPSRDLYVKYPNFEIDVAHELELSLAHDPIVLQLPFYWYSATPLLKKWLDDVLTYGFAYGCAGGELHGKDLQLIMSVGGQPKYYSGFRSYATIHELLRPFERTANQSGMNYQIPIWMHHADAASVDIIRAHGAKWIEMIDDPLRSDPQAYLNSEPDETLELAS